MPSDFIIDLLSGASAGAVGKIACHPIDTCKSLCQSGLGRRVTAIQAFRNTYASGGIAGLYRGIGAVLIGGTPATMIYLTSYEGIKKYMEEHMSWIPGPVVHLAGGMFAEAISCTIFVPVDVIKERMQVYQPTKGGSSSVGGAGNNLVYRNSFDSFKSIMRTEGLGGIYKGYGATLLSFGPYSALYFVGYEYIRGRAAQYAGKKVEDLSFSEVLACSALAGSIASYITTPLDLVKLRMQIVGGQNPGAPRPSMRSMLSEIYHTNGVAGLFRGSMARVGAFTPCVAVSMAVFESCKKLWGGLLS